jgi:hypothetical protein
MKTAKLNIPCVEFICPYCDEFIDGPHGHLHEIREIPEQLTCFSCKRFSHVPKRALKMKYPTK